MARRDRFRCCGVRIDDLGPEAAVAALLESRYGQPRRVHLCNSYNLAIAMQNPHYRDLLNASDLNLADGHYVALVGRWRGFTAMTDRVYGPDLMLNAMDRGRSVGLRHYLYGTTPETVNRLAAVLHERFPGVDIVGVQAPPFRELTPEEEADLHERVAAAKPDIVWVGIGTPRQDEFVARQAAHLRCTLVPVGAAFDFHAGTKKAAPRAVQRIGMEWLFRLITEPRRLWRRYLIGIPIFLYGVLADVFRRENPPEATTPGERLASTSSEEA
ncbi:MAG TPA: WecB/TagA/CpsF family glycosyltransferase [Micromonosporaceae bacterium]|nr:WecB/TagA/CpsF family glycosyltransferase [Micromonosporaceae bacterium]